MQRSYLAPLFVFVTAAVPGIPAAAEPTALLPDSPNVPFVEYRLEIGQIGHADNTQWLRVYPDGRGLAHYPAFTRRAGTYEFQLSPGEVAELAQFLVDRGVLVFDQARAKQQQQAIIRERVETARADPTGSRVIRSIHDAPITRITVRLGVSAAPAGKPVPAGVIHERVMSWYALDWHAREFPEIESLGRLAETEARLLELFDRADLRSVE